MIGGTMSTAIRSGLALGLVLELPIARVHQAAASAPKIPILKPLRTWRASSAS